MRVGESDGGEVGADVVGLGVVFNVGSDVGLDVGCFVGSDVIANAAAQFVRSMGSFVGLGVLVEKAASQLEKSGVTIGSSVGRRVGDAVVGLGVVFNVGSDVVGLLEGE